MADDPPCIHEQPTEPLHDSDSSCPFCTITATFQPISPVDTANVAWDPERLSPPTFVLLSTEHVVAFLDIAPLTRGHVLLTPRHHRVKIGNCSTDEAAEIGRVLPIITRAVLEAVLPDIPHEEVDYNVVQNNGPGAAQVIPHVHFHIIPRPPLDYKAPTTSSSNSRSDRTSKRSPYAQSAIPTGLKASFVQFGRGQRYELDEDDAAVLVRQMRENVKVEWEREFGRKMDDANRSCGEESQARSIGERHSNVMTMAAKL